jgi:hypothetical protein
MRLAGLPLTLLEYPARTTINARFRDWALPELDRLYLPPGLSGLSEVPPVGRRRFLEDDHRGAVSPEPVATLDGLAFHLSIKGVGSTTDPYSARPLDAALAATLTEDADVRGRLRAPPETRPPGEPERLITGERWLRGSPYGGQGLEHASIALRVSERADLTSIAGFRIAPVLKIAHLPPELAERLRTIRWYRRFEGELAQELRLVPSNVRIYFHARSTVGHDVRQVFDAFGLDAAEKVLRFETAFLRTAVPLLTLFARTLRHDATKDRYCGLDFHDVWLDKDAVLAPDGSVYFVDLEGIEEASVERAGVREKIEDQVYRSLYEVQFAFEQLETERARRFGADGTRKERLVSLAREALRDDRFVRLREGPGGAALEIRNPLDETALYTTFPLADR